MVYLKMINSFLENVCTYVRPLRGGGGLEMSYLQPEKCKA